MGDWAMSALPLWIPALIGVEPWCAAVVDALYAVFDRDFRQSRPTLDGHDIRYSQEIRPDGREAIFWHLITKENANMSARNPDPPRAARLAWIRCLIEHCAECEIKKWDYREADGATKTYIWFESGDFLVILKKQADGRRRLLTSFCIAYPNYRRKLEKKFQKRIQN
jgi:hypothetical protein